MKRYTVTTTGDGRHGEVTQCESNDITYARRRMQELAAENNSNRVYRYDEIFLYDGDKLVSSIDHCER